MGRLIENGFRIRNRNIVNKLLNYFKVVSRFTKSVPTQKYFLVNLIIFGLKLVKQIMITNDYETI